MNRPRLFLSAVSDELKTVRKNVAATVRSLGFDPVSQDDFAIAKKLAQADPGNTGWQRDLFVSYWKLTDLAER